MKNRRSLMIILAGAALVSVENRATAQKAKSFSIAYLALLPGEDRTSFVAAFVRRLNELGYIDGETRFPRLAASPTKETAKALGISTQIIEVSTADEIEQAFAAIARSGFDGACVTGAPLYNERIQVGASVLAHKVPTIAGDAEQVCPTICSSLTDRISPDYFRCAVGYADKIL